MGSVLSSGSEGKSELQRIYDTRGDDAFIKAVWDGIIRQEDYQEFRGMVFDYECLAFEGGGVKGSAYLGAIKVLEDLGILSNIKRFAGTSAGAYMAMQLAIGIPADTILKTSGIQNLQDLFYDSGTWALPINILKGYGWQSGEKMLAKIQGDLQTYFGDKNATFLDLYKKRGVELCVVVTDLSGRSVEYLHPKVTPTVKIAEAVRTSMSLPFLFAPTTVVEQDMYRFFVDGGLLENYPIRVFDGWYLSMASKDDFFERMSDDPSTKFVGLNKKTLGMIVFSHEENQSQSEVYAKRYIDKLFEGRPNSALSKEREFTRNNVHYDVKEQTVESARLIVQYIGTNLKDRADEMGTFSFEAFKEICEKLAEDDDMSIHLERLMGPKGFHPLKESFEKMDINKDNRLSLVECLQYLQKKGIYLRYNLRAQFPRKIESVTSFITANIEVMQCYISELQEKPEDVDRTIGIYTDYVTTTDFNVSLDDKAYLLRQGYNATIAFLKQLKNNE